jgi:hypothetical protein
MTEQKQLFYQILEKISEAGLSQHMVMVGSWCNIFYQDYLKELHYHYTVRTTDLDICVPTPVKTSQKTDFPAHLKSLGFHLEFNSANGLHRLRHPELDIELITPERGKGETVETCNIPQVSMNAQKVRYLDILLDRPLTWQTEKYQIQLPRPEAFALHKIILSTKRTKPEKAKKDIENALLLLRSLMKHQIHKQTVQALFQSFPKGWKKTIRKKLHSLAEHEMIDQLEPKPKIEM